MYCKKCGKEIADDSDFCSKCGTKVNTDFIEKSNVFTLFGLPPLITNAVVLILAVIIGGVLRCELLIIGGFIFSALYTLYSIFIAKDTLTTAVWVWIMICGIALFTLLSLFGIVGAVFMKMQ